MTSAAESIEKGVDSEIANLNKRIRAIEQNMSAMKEFIKEALVQGNWPGGNSGRPVPTNTLGSSVGGAEEKTVSKGFESDNSSMESKPEEMGGTSREERGLNIHQFKFLGKIESREVVVFVGLSATHNFISKELVNALGIPLQRTQGRFRVNFVCGPGYEGAEVCEGVVLKTQGIEIVETFFVTDLSIADVVLGHQWMRSFGGDMTFQGTPMSLTFKWQGRIVKLQADPSLSRRNEVGIMTLDWI